uniref:Uncharacterized protein n=1 Tax=Solanum tuberosum TaxID=4113 RepID=M1DV91_SOLTU
MPHLIETKVLDAKKEIKDDMRTQVAKLAENLVQICVAADHSASLVGITNQLGDSTFGVVHHRLAPTFSIVVLWVIGRHGTASWNFSVMHRLLPISTEWILSFRAQHTGTKGKVRPSVTHQVKSVIIMPTFFRSSWPFRSLLGHSVHAFFQTSNT